MKQLFNELRDQILYKNRDEIRLPGQDQMLGKFNGFKSQEQGGEVIHVY